LSIETDLKTPFWKGFLAHWPDLKLSPGSTIKDIYLKEYLNFTDLTVEYITGLSVKN